MTQLCFCFFSLNHDEGQPLGAYVRFERLVERNIQWLKNRCTPTGMRIVLMFPDVRSLETYSYQIKDTLTSKECVAHFIFYVDFKCIKYKKTLLVGVFEPNLLLHVLLWWAIINLGGAFNPFMTLAVYLIWPDNGLINAHIFITFKGNHGRKHLSST